MYEDKKDLFWSVGASFAGPNNQEFVGASLAGPNKLSNIGNVVDKEISKINMVYETNIEINNYVIMPNHIHMIIVIHNEKSQTEKIPSIQRIIQQFKGSITKQVGFPLWQKSFHDHIIRNQSEYEKIYEYIETNPLKWEDDKYYLQTGQHS